MSISFYMLELIVIATGVGILLGDLWTPPQHKRSLGIIAASVLGLVLLLSYSGFIDSSGTSATAFSGLFVQDGLSLFFKRLFLVGGILVLLMAVEFSDSIRSGQSEYVSLTLLALAGMMTAASSNDFSLMFVSVELVAVTFYILTSFQRSKVRSLEAGVKYLILGAVASAFLVFGIAMVYAASGTMNFTELSKQSEKLLSDDLANLGYLFILAGLGFKIATFPTHWWAPDVYEGAPSPTTTFLSIGSKATGFVLLLRVFYGAALETALSFEKLFMVVGGCTILYGSLCAIPQRNLKRLLGYSSIANAGYLFLGISASTASGGAAVLFYLVGYLFSVVAAFYVITIVSKARESEDISEFSGLASRSPFLAFVLALAMVSLAGVPPLAGFMGKFMLIKAAAEQAVSIKAYYTLISVAVVGVIISLYYYFNVIRSVYWGTTSLSQEAYVLTKPTQFALGICVIGMLFFGILPTLGIEAAVSAVKVLKF